VKTIALVKNMKILKDQVVLNSN